MPCPQCGTESAPGAKFCSECATPLAAACPACGTANPPGAKFCIECATPLTAIAAQRGTGVAAPVAERRLVTVLFADLVGFTPFAEERDAEDVRETLSRYFDMARQQIERYGGTVEKFIGDAVMAVWGAPIAREDDAERAVRAALELVADVRSLGDSIQARAGVLTGEVAVTIGAVDQGMVAGDIVNTAARLQAVAEPGTVLVGESTARAAAAAIAFEQVGETALKGKALPVPAHRALRVVAERGGRNRSGSLEAPFVGRDEELRQIKDQYHAVTREGRPRLVSVMGPAGIGKSRLAWEFSKYTDGLFEEMWWHEGRCPAYGEGITFWALGEMIRRRAGLAESDDETATRAAITQMLATHVPDPEERRWIEPAMLTLLGIGDQEGGSELHFAAWRTFFERMALTGPVTLLFEDLHWADSGLLDFIDHVLEWTRDQPIYIVTLARPELLERRPNWGAGKRQFTSIFLEPMPETAIRELLSGLVPGLPASAMQGIVARADGVPLYAVETVRMLVAEGKLEERDGAYVPVGDLADLAIPDSLTALIASRLDALDPTDRAVLQDAAVLGQTFTPDALAAVHGATVAELEPRLRQLVRRELLVLRADPRAPDRGQYAFVQSLIREVAYNTLARADRKARHLAAARHFESLPTEELAGALAQHYLSAHANAAPGAEADALAAQARVALRSAADRANALGAPQQAARCLVQALDVTADRAEEADLHERTGEAMGASGHHDAAVEHFRQARDIRTELGDRPGALRAAAGAGRLWLDGYRTEQALQLLEQARSEYSDLESTPEFVILEGQLARAYFFAENLGHAMEAADRTLAAAEQMNLTDVLADTLITKGTVLAMVGRSREGLLLISGGGELAQNANLAATALRAAVNRGFAESLIDPRRGFDSSRAGLDLARRIGNQSLAIVLLGNACEYAIRTGDWEWAERELRATATNDLDPGLRTPILSEQILYAAAHGEDSTDLQRQVTAIAEQSDDLSTRLQALVARAWASWMEERDADAYRMLSEVVDASVQGRGEMLLYAARVSLWQRDADHLRSDLQRFAETGTFGRAVEAWAGSLRAGLMSLDGATGDALPIFRDSFRTMADLRLPWDQALVAIDMATVLPADHPDVVEAASRAREILGTLGAKPLLARLDRLLGQAPPAATQGAVRGSAVAGEVA